jgi:hypothetical protein
MLLSPDTAGCSLRPLLDVGLQPLANRYRSGPGDPDELFPLCLGISETSGLIAQLMPAPASAVRSRFPWIRYNEAEAHLDDLCDRICRLPGTSTASSVLGISYKDDSTLSRLAARGFRGTRRLDVSADLGSREANAGLETIQERLTLPWARSFVEKHGEYDIVVARHILEHAHERTEFLEALRVLVRQGGYIVLEVPDCSKFLEAFDYTMLWEEHISYFTASTFRNVLNEEGFEPVWNLNYLYALENSLVTAVRKGPETPPNLTVADGGEAARAEIAKADRYAEGYAPLAAKMRDRLARYRREKGKIAILGAGHLACAFVNVLGVRDSIDLIVDDAAEKRGLFLPGSDIAIRPSSDLLGEGIKLCMLSVNHDAAGRVMARNEAFLRAGNEFCSIFRTGPLCLSL